MRQHPTGYKTECHLHSNVDEVHDASPAAAGQQRKGGKGLARGPNPATLQITLLTISTGTPQSDSSSWKACAWTCACVLCTFSKIRGEPVDNVPAQTVRRL